MPSAPQNSIPREIKDFFTVESGQTLLIKGLPGTGKTTLALEIMNSLCEDRNGMYISTRVDPRRLYATNPWVEEVVPPKNVVNATQTKLLESLKGVGKDLSNYYAVLDFFKVFFDEAEEMDNPMIIIDSWDAVLNYTAHLIGDAQHSFEQNICEFARDLDTHLIFVSEFASVMPLDYIVDGGDHGAVPPARLCRRKHEEPLRSADKAGQAARSRDRPEDLHRHIAQRPVSVL
jgi:RecA-family ATPase